MRTSIAVVTALVIVAIISVVVALDIRASATEPTHTFEGRTVSETTWDCAVRARVEAYRAEGEAAPALVEILDSPARWGCGR